MSSLSILAEAATKKDSELLKKLETVYVTSEDPVDFDPDVNRKMYVDPNRPLPEKYVVSVQNQGFMETAKAMGPAKPGQLTVDDAQQLISDYWRKPNNDNLNAIAKEHQYVKSDFIDIIASFTSYFHILSG